MLARSSIAAATSPQPRPVRPGCGRLLLKVGTDRHDLIHFGSQSLKATVLSWLSKRGVPREVRAALGYRPKAVDGTEVVYGRDNVAAPLRVMMSVLHEIVEGVFRPDETKSGMLSKSASSDAGDVNIMADLGDELGIQNIAVQVHLGLEWPMMGLVSFKRFLTMMLLVFLRARKAKMNRNPTMTTRRMQLRLLWAGGIL